MQQIVVRPETRCTHLTRLGNVSIGFVAGAGCHCGLGFTIRPVLARLPSLSNQHHKESVLKSANVQNGIQDRLREVG